MTWVPLATTNEQPHTVLTTGPEAKVMGFDYIVRKFRGRWEYRPCSRHCQVYFIVETAALDAWHKVMTLTERSVSIIWLPKGVVALPHIDRQTYAPDPNSNDKLRFMALVFGKEKVTNGRKTYYTMKVKYRRIPGAPKTVKKATPVAEEYQPIPISFFAQQATLTWEILPPDTTEDQLLRQSGGNGRQRNEVEGQRQERIVFLTTLQPLRWWRGIPLRGEREYLVAEFDRLVVAECPFVGNAIYAFRKTGDNDWQKVFQKTKTEGRELGAIKIVHAGNWQGRLRQHVG